MSTALSCRAYNSASDLPPEFWDALMKNEAAANIILPFAQKALEHLDKAGDDQLWIVCYDDICNDVEFLLSCTRGPLGNYPIFIYTPKSSAQLVRDEKDGKNISGCLRRLVLCLLDNVPAKRVFSVFSVAYVAEEFAKIFKEHTHQRHGISPIEKPYYDATFTFCTRETLKKSPTAFTLPGSRDVIIALQPVDGLSYLEGIKTLCKEFSKTSPPYELDDEHAEVEARGLLTDNQVWVHMAKAGGEDSEIACLVATTRQSQNVTAITKVFTAEKWRGLGCAGRLLYRICQEVLQKKERVVLYVGNGDSGELVAARKVYHKVGFQGLDTSCTQAVKNVERWVEIGFEGTMLGYW